MNNITEIKQSPSQEVIDRLEYLLQQAKDGEIRSISYAIGYRENVSAAGFVIGTNGEATQLIGEMVGLQVRMSNLMVPAS